MKKAPEVHDGGGVNVLVYRSMSSFTGQCPCLQVNVLVYGSMSSFTGQCPRLRVNVLIYGSMSSFTGQCTLKTETIRLVVCTFTIRQKLIKQNCSSTIQAC